MKKVFVCCAVLLVCAVGVVFAQSNADLAQAAYDRGNTALNQGNYDAAIREYTEAIRLLPNSFEPYFNRGLAYFEKKDWDAAIPDFTQAIQLNADFAGAYYWHGRVYREKSDYDRAITDFTQAIRLNPNYADAYYDRAVAYYQRGIANRNSSDINSAAADADTVARLESNSTRSRTLKNMVDRQKNSSLQDMLPLLAAPVAIVLIYFVFFPIASRKARKAETVMDENDFVIRQPKVSLKLYIFVTVFFFLLYGFSLLGLADDGIDQLKARWWVFLLSMSPLLLMGPFLTVLWYRWKIAVKEDTITACSYFGGKKTFAFDYITAANYNSTIRFVKAGQMMIDSLKAYHEGKKLFAVTSVCAGFQVLVARLKDSGVPVNWK